MLPWSWLRDRLSLPTKVSFYYHVGILSVLNAVQCVGSGLILYNVAEPGLCVVDVTTILYYSLFTPFVYYTFLSDFFRYGVVKFSRFLTSFSSSVYLLSVAQPILLFSYKSQVDDMNEEENMSLPHQHSFSSFKADSDYIYQARILLVRT